MQEPQPESDDDLVVVSAGAPVRWDTRTGSSSYNSRGFDQSLSNVPRYMHLAEERLFLRQYGLGPPGGWSNPPGLAFVQAATDVITEVLSHGQVNDAAGALELRTAQLEEDGLSLGPLRPLC